MTTSPSPHDCSLARAGISEFFAQEISDRHSRCIDEGPFPHQAVFYFPYLLYLSVICVSRQMGYVRWMDVFPNCII